MWPTSAHAHWHSTQDSGKTHAVCAEGLHFSAFHYIQLFSFLFLYCTVLYCTILYCTQEPSAVKSDEGAIKQLGGGQRFMKSRDIIKIIESGTPPMDKVPPDNQTSPTHDFGL